jgi:hypothetical protein
MTSSTIWSPIQMRMTELAELTQKHSAAMKASSEVLILYFS